MLLAVSLFFAPIAASTSALATDTPKDSASSRNSAEDPVLKQMALIAVDPFSLPIELVLPPLPVRLRPGDGRSWKVPLLFRSVEDDLRISAGSTTSEFHDGRALLVVQAAPGMNVILLTLKTAAGKSTDLKVEMEIVAPRRDRLDSQACDVTWTEPPDSSSVSIGPFATSWRLTREGSAVGGSTAASSILYGIRASYRKRVLPQIFTSSPGAFRLFVEAEGAVGRTATSAGEFAEAPVWAGGRIMLQKEFDFGMTVEGGLGISFFTPLPSTDHSGDLNQILSPELSLGATYPLLAGTLVNAEAKFTLPNTDGTPGASLYLSRSRELSLGLKRGALDARVIWFQADTQGAIVLSGDFHRAESLIGPEIRWTLKF